MAPARIEDKPQEEVLLLLRGAIDTAMKHPSDPNKNAAIALAVRYPKALSGGKLRLNLGKERWDWLRQHGVYPAYGGVTEPDYTG